MPINSAFMMSRRHADALVFNSLGIFWVGTGIQKQGQYESLANLVSASVSSTYPKDPISLSYL